MAYNYFPMNYGQNPYNMQNYQQIQQQMQQMQPTQMQMQSPQVQQMSQQGGYVTVRSEEEARNYPVALGTSVTFFNETQPFCYKKTMGNSPLDKNDFRIYKITEISDTSEMQKMTPTTNETEQANTNTTEQIKSQIDTIFDELGILKKQVAELQAKKTTQSKKIKEVEQDEPID